MFYAKFSQKSPHFCQIFLKYKAWDWELRCELRVLAGKPICVPKCELSSSGLGSNPSLLYVCFRFIFQVKWIYPHPLFTSIHPISRSNFHKTNCVARSFSSPPPSRLLAFAKCKVRSVLYSYLDAQTCLLVQQTVLFYYPWFCFNIFYETFSPYQSFPIMNWMSATAIWFTSICGKGEVGRSIWELLLFKVQVWFISVSPPPLGLDSAAVFRGYRLFSLFPNGRTQKYKWKSLAVGCSSVQRSRRGEKKLLKNFWENRLVIIALPAGEKEGEEETLEFCEK